jgi:hypothetical protein
VHVKDEYGYIPSGWIEADSGPHAVKNICKIYKCFADKVVLEFELTDEEWVTEMGRPPHD